MPDQSETAADPAPREGRRPHLWETVRPMLLAPHSHRFRDIRALFAALNRPIHPLDALLPATRSDGAPDEDAPVVLSEQTPDPRVLDWACSVHCDDENIPSYELKLLVVPPGENQVEKWVARMYPNEEDQVRELLDELADQHAVEWNGTLPEPYEVAELINHAASTIVNKALGATGLPAEQLVDACVPARSAALAGIAAVLEHAAAQQWTAARILEAWELYRSDVEPTPI